MVFQNLVANIAFSLVMIYMANLLVRPDGCDGRGRQIRYGLMLGGSVVVEAIFDWPGLGHFTVLSIVTQDYPATIGVTLIFAVTYVTINLIVDLIYFTIDPRIKIPGGSK